MTTTNRRETLSLLQARTGISATQLAARLGVTERTARRDVAHLRELDAEAGPAGGYRLRSGRPMPPLLESAQERWRAVNGPHLVALVRAGARFDKGVMIERPDQAQEVAA